MTELPFKIRHGLLLDVIGTPISHGAITFVPARVELEGTSFSPVFDLFDWCKSNGKSVPGVLHHGENAPWVLGRLMALFCTENTPQDDRCEKSCLETSFLAVLNNYDKVAIPFQCSDHYGRTSLFFSSQDQPSEKLQLLIASSFYEMLLSEPHNLVDYENRMYHDGAGGWLSFGIYRGEPYMEPDLE